MPNNFLSKIKSITLLMRLNSPTGYLLSFFPAAFGLLLAYESFADLKFLPIFFIGSIIVRSSGCIINDLIDQDFDKKVSRTKNRPIASGKITNKEAIAVLAVLLSLSLAILLSLNKTSIYLGFIAIILIAIYPLMKRYTYFPQAFLGITFNIGCLIGYSAIKDNISIDAILLYVACGFWTMGYDTIYAFMDIDDDKKIGVKSTAIFFENSNVKLIIALFYIIFLALFTIVFIENISFYNVVAIALISSTIYWIIAYLDIKDTENCMSRFKINNYIGFILFLAMLLEKL